MKINYLFCFILAVGFLFLFLFLDWKPAQHDEGVNGWFIEEITAKGYYEYNPGSYHGPLHHYLLFFFKTLMGSNLWALRIPAVLFALASLYLMMMWAPYLGRFTAYAGALLAAVSPGMIFYSRYAIHESALLFFSILTFLGIFRYAAQKDKTSLWFLGLGITGMVLTKETFVIAGAAFVAAWVFTGILERISPSAEKAPRRQPQFGPKDAAHVFLVCAFLYVLFYSGFFLNWKGAFGVFHCFAEWVQTGVAETSTQKGHWKPFGYWFQLFFRYEWAACFGFLCFFPLLAPSRKWHRLILFYGIFNFLIYSLIRYKTPWCILQIIWPFLFAAGAVLERLAERGGYWKGVGVGVVVLLAGLGAQKSVELNFFRYADNREPYVHVQTREELMPIIEKIKRAAEKDPNLKHMPIHVIMKAYWPISWLLLDFTRDDYYTENLPLKADAAVIFCDAERRRRLEMRLEKSYWVIMFQLNPSQKETAVYFDRDIFREEFGTDTPVFYPLPRETAREGEGLVARYYPNRAWEGDPSKEEIAAMLDFAWEGTEKPLPVPFGIVFEGEIFIPKEGETVFYLASDDGSELEMDGRRFINNLGDHAEVVKSHAEFFKPGWYSIRVRHYDIGGGASIRLWWKLPGGAEERILPRYFRYLKSGETV